MDFNNSVVTTVDIAGHNIWITQTHISTWAVMAFLIICAFVARSALTRFAEVPTSGKQNFIELIVETFDKFAVSTMGPEFRAYGNWFFGLGLFILASNFAGLFNLRPPTADVTTTLVFSVTTFCIIHVTAIKRKKAAYFKSYLEPVFVFAPMNIIGELSIIISLAFRMFGNILSGLMIVGILYYMLPWFMTIALPSVLHAYFDIFSGTMQAFVFTMLSMTFIKLKT